jgi:hypothetical protein
MMSKEELSDWAYDNWLGIPFDVRAKCVAYLQEKIPSAVIAKWKLNGYEDFFHFDGGMVVRNLLRNVLTDDKLPPIFYEDAGESYQNWDDFYTGALGDLLQESV